MIENNPIPKKKRRVNKKRVACAVGTLLIIGALVSACEAMNSTERVVGSVPAEAAIETEQRIKTTEPATDPVVDAVAIASNKKSNPEFEEIDLPSYPWTDEDVNDLALTLAGECYADEVEDKRLVCEVILNRVSDDRFIGDTIHEVVSSTEFGVQFKGYWQQSRPVTENDIAIAEETLFDWYANSCMPLSEYRFFCAGDDHKNVFS